MKLLAFVHKAPPEHNAGAEWMLLTIARELVRRGHEFTIYSRGNARSAELDGVKIVPRLPGHKVDRLFAEADVIVTHLDETRGAISRARGKPVVHLVHNDQQMNYHGVRPDEAALVVANSRWIEEAIDWPGPTLVVRPPVFAADYDVDRVEERVTLLNLSEAKGGPLFFELARRMPDVDFLAVRGAYAKQEIPTPLPPNVELVENTPRVAEDVYARTGILLVPSSYESWGRVAIEASSSGIPVVAHPTPGLLESLGDSGIFVDRNDVDGWEQEIRALLEDPEHYADRSARAEARALELDPTEDLDRLDAMISRLGELERRNPIDFAAHTVAYVEHLAPIYLALSEELRGRFFVSSWAHERALEEGIPDEVLRITDADRLPAGGPIVVASFFDLRRTGSRPVIFSEHGAGQTYGNRHSSYAGGAGRERVALFLCPNEAVELRNRKHYPRTPTAVVGSPRVERLLELEREQGPAAVAISFHWRCEVVPEAGTALDFYRPVLAELREKLEAEGIELLGHAHPGIAAELAEVYAELGIEFVPSFADVVARADLYVVDNSSTLFEFAALDRPVVVLNAPQYRREKSFGLRFWTEADVGLNVDYPDELLPTVLRALEDPPEVAEVRRRAVARTYPVTDGAARRAARAIESIVKTPPRCAVCGADHASCGGPTTVVPIDERTRSRETVGTLKRYPNPAKKGAFLLLKDADAERLGLLGSDAGDAFTSRAPSVDVTNEGGAALVSSGATAESAESAENEEPGADAPEGALRPGGPTQRARAKAAANPEEDPVTDPEESTVDDPKDKARPQPTARRRRAASASSKKVSSPKSDES